MNIQQQPRASTNSVISGITLLVVCAVSTFIPGRDVQGQTEPEPLSGAEQSNTPDSHTHMSELVRSDVRKVVVLPGPSPADRRISGTYDKDSAGLVGGMYAGKDAVTIKKEIGGVHVGFPIPILTYPAMIIGGISGVSQRKTQEFRDALTEDLAKAANQPLNNNGLALDVYRGLQRVPSLDSKLLAITTPIPDDTDAILYVNINGVTIEVQDDKAILTTSVVVTLHRRSDGTELYRRKIQYQDRDALKNWTKNGNALWHDYANYARHYLGREISAEVFDRVELRHELRPKKTKTVTLVKRNEWQGVSRSTSPTLAWELTLHGDDSYGSWTDVIDESDIYYDVEIYDKHRLVYAEKQVPDAQHTLEFDIDACKSYRWSVRPSYHIGTDIKFGEWMRFDSEPDDESDNGKGSVGRNASEAPAYIQDYASLNIKCGRK